MYYWGQILLSVFTALPPTVELLGRFDQRQIPEASGVVASRRYPGIFWVHNDSGNAPVLFAVGTDARVVRSFKVAVPNIDWEDIAIDEEGRLYVADTGNNTGFLRLRAIYRFDEPDPTKPAGAPLVPSASYYFALPAGNRFDSESLFCERGVATLIVKARDGRPPQMFTLDLAQPAPLLRPASLIPVGRLADFVEPATGASLSEDGRHLAVCSPSIVRIYRRGVAGNNGWEMVSQVRYAPMAAEGVGWDKNDLILAVEQDGLYRIRERSWKAAARGGAGPDARSR
jgi:hypothetical protein